MLIARQLRCPVKTVMFQLTQNGCLLHRELTWRINIFYVDEPFTCACVSLQVAAESGINEPKCNSPEGMVRSVRYSEIQTYQHN